MKKGAMFGLDCRVLKKEFGELFLTSRQSEAPQGANGSCGYAKRGAMFGLDARIALAIFGALSVISGAALYSAIQQSKVVSIVYDLNELGKAWESFYLDTGINLSQKEKTDNSIDNFYMLDTSELVDGAAISGWAGPYLSYPENDFYLIHPQYKNVHIGLLTDENTWGDDAEWKQGKCTSGKKCFIWSYINGIDSPAIINALDEYVDGGDGLKTGNFRGYTLSDGFTGRVFLKVAPIDNPND